VPRGARALGVAQCGDRLDQRWQGHRSSVGRTGAAVAGMP
jgi:hypothetical protein